MGLRMPWHVVAGAALACALFPAAAQEDAGARTPDTPPRGPFGFSRITTTSGARAPIDDFYVSSDCALCHPRQWKELEGSMHSVAHEDPLYRSFAELARREAGEEVYAYCSGCHSPAGVVSGLIPDVAEADLPAQAKAGVTCDVCHQVTTLSGHAGPWGEPGNASLVLEPGRQKRGPYGAIERNPAHTSEAAEFLSSSEFCASCHTVIHPTNGLRIEHTYDEWKRSVYAERGIQCQDCHMRSVEDARRVAATLEPVEVLGTLARKGPERAIAPHFFVGGNVEAGHLADGRTHARMAEERLKSAAELELLLPAEARTGAPLELEVVVHNTGAGHDLPTSLTELRQVWVHLVVHAGDALLLESGALDAHGELPDDAMRFGSTIVDAEGRETIRPWEAVEFGWKRTIPPKGSAADRFQVHVPADATGPLRVEARLLYRVAAPHVLREVMGARAFEPRAVEMASARASLELAGGSR